MRRASVWVAFGVFLFVFTYSAQLVGGGGAPHGGDVISSVFVILALYMFAHLYMRRDQHRRDEAARAGGARWGGTVAAQPPNMGLGERDRRFFSVVTPHYCRRFARGSLRLFADLLIFEPGKPGPNRPTLRITPDDVAGIGAAPHGPGGVLEIQLQNGDRRQFLLFGPPGSLNDLLRDAGFPVS